MRRVEDAEIASQADREKLMNRLERMASSIDWRLQRLEAAETAAAPLRRRLMAGRTVSRSGRGLTATLL